MNIEEIYKQLWEYDRNEILAKRILHDSNMSPALRAIAHCLLHDYRGCRELVERHNEDPKDVFWLEAQLMLAYLQRLKQNQPIEDLLDEAETLTSLGPNLVFARLLLATILARKKEYQRAISTYESVLSVLASNLSALIGLIGASILAKQPDYARHVLRRALRVVSKIPDTKKRVYWQVIFFIYGFRVHMERSILVGLMTFIMPLFPQPLSWIMLTLVLGAFLLLMLFAVQKKDSWAFSILIRLFVISSISWLIGYGTKALFVFVEGL